MNALFPSIAVAALGLSLCAIDADAQAVQSGKPIEYQPFYPEKWKERQQSTQMIPWEGQHVVFLTTTPDFDAKTMTVFVQRLDDAWELYGDLIGTTPTADRLHNERVTFAAVPGIDFIAAYGRGRLGATGVEVAGFYGPKGDYETVRQNPQTFPHYYFYEMGRNYFVFGDRHSAFTTGFAVYMRYVCLDTLNCEDTNAASRKRIEDVESKLKDSPLSFLELFTMSTGIGEKVPRVKDISPSDQPVVYASAMLKLHRDYGGNEWAKRFFHGLMQCPSAPANTEEGARVQCLNWLVAASCAARQDLSELFATRWKMPIAHATRTKLRSVDWKREGLSPHEIFETLLLDELPTAVAATFPAFLTPERRGRGLIGGGTFEEETAGKWSTRQGRAQDSATITSDTPAWQGKFSLALSAQEPAGNDVCHSQKTAVTPQTQYLLTGWIKTANVQPKPDVKFAHHRVGACLSLYGTYVRSRALDGDNDWTYITLVSDSAEKTEVEVGARLGHWFCPATGTAWFDDICLIELGKTPPK